MVSDGFQDQKGVLGSRARSELKECWQMRSRLMGEGSGREYPVQNRMCGRVALQAMLQQHPGGAAREVQAGGCCKVGRVVYSLFDVEVEEDRKTRSLEAENKELRARIDAMEKKKGVQGGRSIPSKEGGDSEDVWGEFMEVEDEAESRKKLDERKKNVQKELREVDRLSFVSKEMQESIKESLQHHLQQVEKRRHDA